MGAVCPWESRLFPGLQSWLSSRVRMRLEAGPTSRLVRGGSRWLRSANYGPGAMPGIITFNPHL